MTYNISKLYFRENIFKALCRHKQGTLPNVLLFCSRRGGSTWLLNILSAHKGIRYEGRPFVTALSSRHKNKIPYPKNLEDSNKTSNKIFINFQDEDYIKLENFTNTLLNGKIIVYPAINLKDSYFQRKTDRVVYQMTNTTAMVEWFYSKFNVNIILLFRHPIPTALSIIKKGWHSEEKEFLNNKNFCSEYLKNNLYIYASEISKNGTLLEKHVLDWSLKMLIPYQTLKKINYIDCAYVAYEDLVQNPNLVIDYLAKKLNLYDINSMLVQAKKPSRTISKSTEKHIHDKSYILGRWINNINETARYKIMQIPQKFGIDLYTYNSILPQYNISQ